MLTQCTLCKHLFSHPLIYLSGGWQSICQGTSLTPPFNHLFTPLFSHTLSRMYYQVAGKASVKGRVSGMPCSTNLKVSTGVAIVHKLSHPRSQYSLSIRSIDTPYQHTLSTLLINTFYQHALNSTLSVCSQHILPTRSQQTISTPFSGEFHNPGWAIGDTPHLSVVERRKQAAIDQWSKKYIGLVAKYAW